MIKYYYKSVRSTAVKELEKPQTGAWIHAEAPTQSELEELAKQLKLELGHLEDAIDEDEMPRLEREGDQSYIFVRYPHRTAEGELDTSPLLIVFDTEHVLTVSASPLPAADALLKDRHGFATTQRAKLVLLILSHISDQYDVFISQTSRSIKSIRSRLRGKGITNQDLIDFVTIEDELNEFHSSLLPTNATNIKSIANIREAYSAISTNNLNRMLTILTVATILISVPSIAMGIYSLNIPLPFQTTHWIFWVIMAVNVTLISCVIYIARKKRVI
jgi:magnesium transporter